jgi:hypothetical protein
MDQARPGLPGPGEGPEQLVQGMDLPSPALAGEASRLVQRQEFGVLLDHEAADEGDFVGRERGRGLFLSAHPGDRRDPDRKST